MISVPGTGQGYTGSLDMLGYEEVKSPTSSHKAVLFKGLLDPSRPSGVSRQSIRRKDKTLNGQSAFGIVAWSL
jgi:hypothetical protein